MNKQPSCQLYQVLIGDVLQGFFGFYISARFGFVKGTVDFFTLRPNFATWRRVLGHEILLFQTGFGLGGQFILFRLQFLFGLLVHPVNEENAIQMIGFMLHRAGQ